MKTERAPLAPAILFRKALLAGRSKLFLMENSQSGIRHWIVGRGAVRRRWDPSNPAPELPRDCVYFGKALVEMEKDLPGEEIDCYTTWDPDSLPEYGPHVVALLVGEEWGLIPRYARHVRLVARVMSRYPFLGVRTWWPLTWLKLLLSVKHLRNWARHFRSVGRFWFPPSSWPPRVHTKASIVHIPWGSAALTDLPMKNMAERSRNYYFSGGVSYGLEFGFRRFSGSPKAIARQSLVEAVARLEKQYPHLASDQAVKVHTQVATGDLQDMDDYAQGLMDTKVCLAPRGSVADTWRFFEGLKSGCVVITNPLPDEWYYRNAPVIQIESWDELEQVLPPLLADESRLESMHAAAVKYWQEVCGEQALGRFLAKAIRESDADVNSLAPVLGSESLQHRQAPSESRRQRPPTGP